MSPLIKGLGIFDQGKNYPNLGGPDQNSNKKCMVILSDLSFFMHWFKVAPVLIMIRSFVEDFEVAKSTDPSSHRSVPQQTTSRDLPLKRCGSQEKRFEFEVLLRV